MNEKIKELEKKFLNLCAQLGDVTYQLYALPIREAELKEELAKIQQEHRKLSEEAKSATTDQSGKDTEAGLAGG